MNYITRILYGILYGILGALLFYFFQQNENAFGFALVFVIYLFVVGDLIVTLIISKRNLLDYSYYRSTGIINILFGFIGIELFNFFLRDNGIISEWLFWVGMLGFFISCIIGIIYFFITFTISHY